MGRSGPDWSDRRNTEVLGACSNANWHGHNYELEVMVEGEVDPESGYVRDMKRLEKRIQELVLADLDHRSLNLEVDWPEGTNPTGERRGGPLAATRTGPSGRRAPGAAGPLGDAAELRGVRR